MKESDFVSFVVGIVSGILIAIIMLVAPLCVQDRELRKEAVSVGVARFHPQTGKFEFIKSDISDKKRLTPPTDRL